MFYLGKRLLGSCSDLLGRRLRGYQFRMLLFQSKQPSEDPVIFCIGYLRIIKAVIAVVVMPDLFSQLFYFTDFVHSVCRSSYGNTSLKFSERLSSSSPARRVFFFKRGFENPGLHLRSDSSSETTSSPARETER